MATLVFFSGRFFVLGFGYLTLKPDYMCTVNGVETTCDAEFICSNPDVNYREDTLARNYVNNWVQEMDLICESRNKINVMMSVTFVASCAAGWLFSEMPRRYGNQRVMTYLLFINSLAQVLCLFVANFWIRVLCFGIFGLTQVKMSFILAWIDGFVR